MWEGPPHVCGAIPGLVVLTPVRKQAELALWSKPVSSTPPQLLHHLHLQVSALLEFLFGLPLVMEIETFI